MESLRVVDAMDFGREIHYPVTRILAHERSRVQEILIAELARFGSAKNLWIGAEIDNWKLAPQFSTHDEHRYHQMLAFPPLAALENPEDGIILGGGDWPLAARIAMRRGVKQVKIVDWDLLVGHLVLQHMSEIARFGVHRDPRFMFFEEIDVAKFLPSRERQSADFIFGDLTDVSDLKKIAPDFLGHCFQILRNGGFVAFQVGAYGFTEDRIAAITEGIRDLRQAGFEAVWIWHEYIDSFGYEQCFMAGWKGVSPSTDPVSEDRFRELFDVAGDRAHYSLKIHRRAFTLDLEMEEVIARASA